MRRSRNVEAIRFSRFIGVVSGSFRHSADAVYANSNSCTPRAPIFAACQPQPPQLLQGGEHTISSDGGRQQRQPPTGLLSPSPSPSRRNGGGCGAYAARCAAKPRGAFDYQRRLRLHTVNQRLNGDGRRRWSLRVGGRLGIRGIQGYGGVGRQELYRILQLRQGRASLHWRHDLRRHGDEQLGICPGLAGRLKELAENWNVANEGDLIEIG